MQIVRASRAALAAAGTLAIVVGGCAAPARHGIEGVWKSDARRTLESMRATPGIPDDTRRALEEDFYGHLVLEYRDGNVRAYFDNGNYDSGRRPYRVLEDEPERVVTSEWNELLGTSEETTTYRDGDCIFGLAAEWGFREYFCPFEE